MIAQRFERKPLVSTAESIRGPSEGRIVSLSAERCGVVRISLFSAGRGQIAAVGSTHRWSKIHRQVVGAA